MHITYFNSRDNQKLNETFSYIYIYTEFENSLWYVDDSLKKSKKSW